MQRLCFRISLSTCLLSNFIILVFGIEASKSTMNDFNGWTEVSKGEVVPIVTSLPGCTNSHQKSVLGNMLPCTPRPTLVALPRTSKDLDDNNENTRSMVYLMPSYVSIERCTGSCFGSPSPGAHECQPSATENVTFNVMSVHTTFSIGQWDTICTTATVERHLSCQCSCKQKPEHCNNQIHFYDQASCTCQCKSQAERAVCNTGNGSIKKWDSRTCSCMCPTSSWRPCSTGYTFDFRDSCSCVRTYSMAASGGLTFIVVSVVVFVIVAAFLVIHLKKGRNFNRRVRSDSNIERLLREAFIGDDNVIRMSPVTETGDTTPTTSPNNQR